MRRSICLVALLVIVAVPVARAQMAHRLKGWARTTAGAPIVNARVRADNLSGRHALAAAIDDLRGIARVQ
jgi:hypothetical protein